MQALRETWMKERDWLEKLTEEDMSKAYAEGKWTVMQVLQHLIDCERILSYRALAISRGDQNILPGFDENAYAQASLECKTTLSSIKEEYQAVRWSTVALFHAMSEEQINKQGTANKQSTNPKAIALFLAGHALHHWNVIHTRYFV
jgi:uncharacterized damage-inducible protein DinB